LDYQNAVTDRRIGSSKGISPKLDSTNKIKVISKNNTAEVKIINDKPVSVGTGTNDPNIIVLKDISITNTSVEGVFGIFSCERTILWLASITIDRPPVACDIRVMLIFVPFTVPFTPSTEVFVIEMSFKTMIFGSFVPVQQIMERKRLTMLEKLRAIPPISLSAMKAAASKTLQNAVTEKATSVFSWLL
jgi:hypothetical protein